MKYTITFTDEQGVSKNTWDDFKLIPSARPIFSTPEVKTKTIDIPGGNGSLDLTEALTGYPVYKQRTGSLEFVMTNKSLAIDGVDGYGYNNLANISFRDVNRELLSFFHGRTFKAVLNDDPSWYYEGRFTVGTPTQGKNFSTITLNYEVDPFKYNIFDSLEGDWLWDPFNFVTDDTPESLGSLPATNEWTTKEVGAVGTMPIIPTILVSDVSSDYGGLELVYKTENNPTGVEFTMASNVRRQSLSSKFIMFSRDKAGSSRTYSFRTTAGTCKVSILFRRGEL